MLKLPRAMKCWLAPIWGPNVIPPLAPKTIPVRQVVYDGETVTIWDPPAPGTYQTRLLPRRDYGTWRFRAWGRFWKPWSRLPGLRWGVVLAWGKPPPDWFDQT